MTAAPDPASPTADDRWPPPTRRAGVARWLARLLPLAGSVFFALALAVVHAALAGHRYRDLAAALGALPGLALAASLGLTLAGYAVLCGYDLLALRHVGARVAWRDVAGAALLSGALGNNVGHTLFAGGAVRYWIYTTAGLSAAQIVRVVLFCSLSFWLGFLALGALGCLAAPLALPPAWRLGFATTLPLGLVLAGPPVLWLVLCARGRPLAVGRQRLDPPTPGRALAQLGVGVADLGLMAAALYVLLPPETAPGFITFLPLFLLALVAGTASQVPGGLGVFEAAMLVLLTPRIEAGALAAALLAFRGIYLLLPLLLAAGAVGLRGLLRPRAGARLWRVPGVQALVGAAPAVLAATSFVCGAVLLVSGALPAAVGRLAIVQRLFALPVIEASHFAASLAGAALLVVARGLQRRLDAAWLLAAALLAAGALLSLLKGWDVEEAGVLGLALLALLPLRRQFHRRSALLAEPFTPGWLLACAVVLGGTAWLTAFSHRHLDLAAQGWWQFAWHAEASRSLRALVGALGLFVLLALHRLLRPPRAEPVAPQDAELARVQPLVDASPWTYANLVYRGDKALLVSAAGDAFLMYGRRGRSWVAMGDPVGAEPGVRELAWRFRELSDRHDGWCVFFEVRPARRALYAELGLALTPLGEEARVALAGFTLEGAAHRDLRQARARLLREGCRFEIVPPSAVPGLLPALARLSDAWLAHKAAHEKGFSNASFESAYLSRFPLALVRRGETVLAFANLWQGSGHEELSVDLMRHEPGAPNGTMDFLFAELLSWGRAQGYRWFNFGMAPLAGLDEHAESALWREVGAFVYRHAEHFYNFEGLRRFKAKFDPVWTPLYLASPGGLALAPVLVDVTALIAGSLAGIVTRRGGAAGAGR